MVSPWRERNRSALLNKKLYLVEDILVDARTVMFAAKLSYVSLYYAIDIFAHSPWKIRIGGYAIDDLNYIFLQPPLPVEDRWNEVHWKLVQVR
jgi:hypothetical protein